MNALSQEWAERADLPNHVVTLLANFPTNLHPMAQLSSAVAALHSESKFAQAYQRGIPKTKYWEFIYEDAMDLIAKLPPLAAAIYRNVFKDGSSAGTIKKDRDWSFNFASMMGYEDPKFIELLRLYLTIHR